MYFISVKKTYQLYVHGSYCFCDPQSLLEYFHKTGKNYKFNILSKSYFHEVYIYYCSKFQVVLTYFWTGKVTWSPVMQRHLFLNYRMWSGYKHLYFYRELLWIIHESTATWNSVISIITWSGQDCGYPDLKYPRENWNAKVQIAWSTWIYTVHHLIGAYFTRILIMHCSYIAFQFIIIFLSINPNSIIL